MIKIVSPLSAGHGRGRRLGVAPGDTNVGLGPARFGYGRHEFRRESPAPAKRSPGTTSAITITVSKADPDLLRLGGRSTLVAVTADRKPDLVETTQLCCLSRRRRCLKTPGYRPLRLTIPDLTNRTDQADIESALPRGCLAVGFNDGSDMSQEQRQVLLDRLAPPLLKVILHRFSARALLRAFTDDFPIPSKDFSRKLLTAMPKRLYNSSDEFPPLSPLENLGGIFP